MFFVCLMENNLEPARHVRKVEERPIGQIRASNASIWRERIGGPFLRPIRTRDGTFYSFCFDF